MLLAGSMTQSYDEYGTLCFAPMIIQQIPNTKTPTAKHKQTVAQRVYGFDDCDGIWISADGDGDGDFSFSVEQIDDNGFPFVSPSASVIISVCCAMDV